jgi:sulfur-carrier protein adenylyltransferase/sulfurtransferase
MPDFGEAGQALLRDSKVLIIGCGGLGVPSALYLNSSGVGTLGLMDADTISESNLHRQVIFRESDIGRSKLERLQEFLEAQNPLTHIEAFHRFAQSEQLLETIASYDLVMDCTDNFDSRYLINDACVLANKPLVYGAVNLFEGQVAVFNVLIKNEQSGNYRDLFPTAPEAGTIQNCEEAGVMGHMPGIIGTIMAGEALKYLTQKGEVLSNRLLLLDGLTLKTNTFKYKAKTRVAELKVQDFSRSCKSFMVPTVSWSDIKTWVAENKTYELIDVREIGEHQKGNAGGRNIPLSTLNLYLNELADLKRPLVFYCKSGQRSGRAVHDLLEDHKDLNIEAFSLEGGMNARPSPT